MKKVTLQCKGMDARPHPKNGKIEKVILQCKGMYARPCSNIDKPEKVILWCKGMGARPRPKNDVVDLKLQFEDFDKLKTSTCRLAGSEDFNL
ncbi:hypothetical protein HAX54_023203 [Datura stramonium]|uniref:Uncharacterized protein n=1 Tax=Datura stramonium TaxID=4076 RepID=A0ABS8S508_DATST|nr:hypothetical protein [Datura stramonium]